MWELDHKEGWALKNWCFRTVVLQKTLESPLDSKEIRPVNPKGNKPWILIGRNDAETESPITWQPDHYEELTHWKRPWCWERLRAEGEEGVRGWDGWMVSLIQRTWTWANSGSWWGTGRTSMLQSTGSESWTRLGNWATITTPAVLRGLLIAGASLGAKHRL